MESGKAGQERGGEPWPERSAKAAWRFRLGLGVSVFWLIGAGVLMYWKRAFLADMDLNALGDFAAGVFAPLAFLWLVLGYLQQGEDLQHSTEALKLQARELSQSVKR